jgi:hypothetical protein
MASDESARCTELTSQCAAVLFRHRERNEVKRGNPESLHGEFSDCGVVASWVAASRFAFLAMTKRIT